MKYHKIPGVAKEICTAEQMLAYNIMHNEQSRFAPQWDSAAPAIAKAEARAAIMAYIRKVYFTPWRYKHDADATYSAILAGLIGYMDSRYKILTTYSDVGKAFPAHYIGK